MADDIVDAPASTEPTPIDSPVVDPVPEAVDPTPPPETPEPAPAEEKQDGLGDLTDEELNAAIDAAQEILDAAAKKPSKPTNFPEKKEAVALDSDIDALIQQKDTEIEAAKQTAQEATTKMQDVEKAW